MSDYLLALPALHGRTRSWSMGLKLIIVCGLALLMSLPALFVSSLTDDRASKAAAVVDEVAGHVGGQQTFLGPTLAVPYTAPPAVHTDAQVHGVAFLSPEQANASVKTRTEERKRSLFRVPVFQADVRMNSSFDLSRDHEGLPAGAVLDWSQAEVVVGVSDSRGALADGTVTVDGRTSTLSPAHNQQHLSLGSEGKANLNLTLLGARGLGIAAPAARLNVSSTLHFSGAQRLALLAYGKTTQLSMEGDWPNPGFDGGFLPVKRSVSRNGFSAEWTVPFIARGVGADSLSGLQGTALGVSFIEVADPYQSVNRSLKYVPLFIGLVFLSYFIFEVTTAKRVHPAQYVLVGIAQIIFYLLLLSLSERIGFDFGFLIAGSATVTLLAANAEWVFGTRAQGIRAFAVFSLLYVLIYLLLRLEDNALLLGASASFLIVAGAMYATRNIDWYHPMPLPEGSEPDAQPG